MRAKFFIISFLVLLFSTISVTGILMAYFRSEKITFLDEKIREAATSIIESKLSELKNYDDDEADDIISEELGPERIGKFFVVRNSEGEILFETKTLALLDVELPISPRWVTIKTDNHYVRVLNLNPSKYKSRLLQVGVVVDASFLSLMHMSERTYLMVGAIVCVTFLLTWLLSYVLFSPIDQLAQYLNKITEKLKAGQEIEIYRKPALRFLESKKANDEFARLENAINQMSLRLNEGRKFMKSWTWKMAHELKTPLAILNRDLEVLFENNRIEMAERELALSQIRKISTTITSFLDWSELTQQQQRVGNLFVLDVVKSAKLEVESLNRIYSNRVQVQADAEVKILINPLHIEQLIRNLVENSLKYSEGLVEVKISDNKLLVRDRGPGIPQTVLNSLGQPFNKGSSTESRGLGLGLAWVGTICKVYGLEMSIVSNSGCEVVIDLQPVAVDNMQE